MQQIAMVSWAEFNNATLVECENYLRRKCAEGLTVDSLLSQLRGEEFDPDSEVVGEWFDRMVRLYRPVRGAVSLMSFYEILAKLLPDDEDLHPALQKLRRPPETYREVMEKAEANEATSSMKAKLIAAQTLLQKAAGKKEKRQLEQERRRGRRPRPRPPHQHQQ